MPAPEGRKILIILMILTLFFGVAGYGNDNNQLILLYYIFGLIFVFCINFFRDPQRIPPDGKNNLVSPADGKIVLIKDIEDKDVGKAIQISIFLSVFNVHSNKIPINGQVISAGYKEGDFKAAFDHRASNVNEQAYIVLSHGENKIKIKQIAGLIARRIICYAKVGDSYKTGDRFGFIMFGSRTDLIVPSNSDIHAKVGEKVKGGKTIIGQLIS